MYDIVTALWLAMQDDETPKEPDEDEDEDEDDEEDEGGGGLTVTKPPRPQKWPPRIRLFLPRLGQPVPVPVGAS